MIPDMIARGQYVSSGVQQFLGGTRGYTETAGNILGIDDNQVRIVLLPQFGQEPGTSLPAWFANHITNSKYYHQSMSASGSQLRVP